MHDQVAREVHRGRALEKVGGLVVGETVAGVEGSRDLDEVRNDHRRDLGVAGADARRDSGHVQRHVGRVRLEPLADDVVARIGVKPEHRARLEREVAGDVAELSLLDIVGACQDELEKVETGRFCVLGTDRPSTDPVRQGILEPVRLWNQVGLVGPDGQAVEVVPDDLDVVHARLDRVEQPVEACPAAHLVHARSAALDIAPELDQFADAWLVLGVFDLHNPSRQRRVDSGDGRAVRGDTPPGEGRHRRARERDRPQDNGMHVDASPL